MKKTLPFLILIISLTSMFLLQYNFISIIISTITLILSLVIIKNKRLYLITIIISILTIITNITILYKEYNLNTDIFKNKNILLGTWKYNENGGTYLFNDNYTYKEYASSNKEDKYCSGKYNYNYGGLSNETIIKQDDNYYYYTLYFKEEYCVINSIKVYKDNDYTFVFGVNKNNYKDLIFINTNDNYAFKVTKIK